MVITFPQMFTVYENLWPFTAIFSFWNSQKLLGAIFCGLILSVFWPKTHVQKLCYEQVHYYDARSKYQIEVQVFPDEQPLLAMPLFPNNSAGKLYGLV